MKPDARKERLAAALRENLRRRKARERALAGRRDAAAEPPPNPRPNKDKKPGLT